MFGFEALDARLQHLRRRGGGVVEGGVEAVVVGRDDALFDRYLPQLRVRLDAEAVVDERANRRDARDRAERLFDRLGRLARAAEGEEQRRRDARLPQQLGAVQHIIDAEGFVQAGEDRVRQAAYVEDGAAAARPAKELRELAIDLAGLEDHRQVQADAGVDERLEHLLGVIERTVEAGIGEDDGSGALPLQRQRLLGYLTRRPQDPPGAERREVVAEGALERAACPHDERGIPQRGQRAPVGAQSRAGPSCRRQRRRSRGWRTGCCERRRRRDAPGRAR